MKSKMIAAAAACIFAAPGFSASGNNFVDGYFVPEAEVDVGSFDDDGDGFGIKGGYQLDRKVLDHPFFLVGEYQSIDYDDTDAEIDQLRLGADIGPGAGPRAKGIYGRGEYIRFDDSDDEADSFGGHVGYGLPLSQELRLHGQVGYLILGDVDGPEFLFGGSYQFQPNLAAFAEYRNSDLEFDDGGDVDLSEFRIGARFLF